MQTVKQFEFKNGLFVPFVDDEAGGLVEVAWAPLPGSQEAFLKCAETEVLYEGTRGGGKSIALLADFAQHVGQGYGQAWRGLMLRRSHPQLKEIIALSRELFLHISPGAQLNEMKSYWTWPTGEKLYFSHFDIPSQYADYHGHSYPWIGWEELTTWPNPDCYKVMFACSRSVVPGMPRKIRATTNPYGVGHNWVQHRFRLPLPAGQILGPVIDDARDEKGHAEPTRRSVHSHLDENLLLMHTDPNYKQRIRAAARNESELHAWLDGSWEITAGGILDDIWHSERGAIVVPQFEVPLNWKITRAFDYGSSKPFSIGWYAESDGSDLTFPDGRVRSTLKGDLYRVAEWYGWNGRANEGLRMLVKDVAVGIKKLEEKHGWSKRVRAGPADTSIFDENNGVCIADDFEKTGILWERADKGPHSRVQGLDQLRKRLKATRRPEGGIREEPGLFICENCVQWLRTVPTLQRDERNFDDADSEGEDHTYDETRYRLRFDTTPKISTRRRQLV